MTFQSFYRQMRYQKMILIPCDFRTGFYHMFASNEASVSNTILHANCISILNKIFNYEAEGLGFSILLRPSNEMYHLPINSSISCYQIRIYEISIWFHEKFNALPSWASLFKNFLLAMQIHGGQTTINYETFVILRHVAYPCDKRVEIKNSTQHWTIELIT